MPDDIPQPATVLPWPPEPVPGDDAAPITRFDAPPSNCLLDFHGSLQSPDLVLFMAGNQFRVLPPLLQAFRAHAPGDGIRRVFYATTPPGRLIDAMRSGRLASGNFVLEVSPNQLWPDVFMAGPREHQRLAAAGWVDGATRYARNRGMALLVRSGNPLSVRSVADLARPDVRVAISSREREPASFESYAATLRIQGGEGLVDAVMAKPSTVSPAFVHHREVPQLIADGRADAAPIFRHLADYLVTHMPQHFAMVDLPAEGNAVDELSIAVLRNAQRPQAAQAWREFLLGAEAAALLAAHGFEAGAGDAASA